MKVPPEPEDYQEKIKKQNRQRRLEDKTHKIVHESGRSLKKIWQQIVARSKKKEES